MSTHNIFSNKDKKELMSIYFTAGYPELNSTVDIAERLEQAGVDFLEIGFPYSDPIADGPVIQQSSEVALKNGMTLEVLFQQLKNLRERVSIPIFLMGYFNPVLQYGVERFCKSCQEVGINGAIIPDLPMYEYEALYKDVFESHGISNIFLITPQTSTERIRKIDQLSTNFIYVLSANATTGKDLAVNNASEQYFQRLKDMELNNPLVIGFGISNAETFHKATSYAKGAILGTAFVRTLANPDYLKGIAPFIGSIRQEA